MKNHRLIAIAGATGYLGRYLVQASLDRGYKVRVLTQDASRLPDHWQGKVDVFEAQVIDPRSLRGFAQGATWLLSSVGITSQRDGYGYEEVDYQGNANLLEEAEASGVERFGYIGVFNGKALAHTAMVGAKERFVERLGQSSVPGTVIRPTGFFSDMGEFLAMAKRGSVALFGKGDQLLNPIDGSDLATFTLDAMEKDGESDGFLEHPVGGPDTYTMKQIGQLAFSVLGKKPRFFVVPHWLRKLALVLLPIFTPRHVWGPAQMFLSAADLSMVALPWGRKSLTEYLHQLNAM